MRLDNSVWLTRSSFNGQLDPLVEVWVARPDRVRFEDPDVGQHGFAWSSSGDTCPGTMYGELLEVIPLQVCREVYGLSPDTDRECILCPYKGSKELPSVRENN